MISPGYDTERLMRPVARSSSTDAVIRIARSFEV
jgi:hypothetical protein|tara:strand:- start:12220 stop:12321 length:102 start_codon:yes stop_codon:yes gene_type:complete